MEKNHAFNAESVNNLYIKLYIYHKETIMCLNELVKINITVQHVSIFIMCVKERVR